MAMSGGSEESSGKRALSSACALVSNALDHVDDPKSLKGILSDLLKVLQSAEIGGRSSGVFSPASRGQGTCACGSIFFHDCNFCRSCGKPRSTQEEKPSADKDRCPSVNTVVNTVRTGGPSGNSDIVASMHRQERFKDAGKFQKTLNRFFEKIDGRYSPTAVYHGSSHACDVMSTMCWFLRSISFKSGSFIRLTDTEHMMGLVAAAIHDVGHMGRNNGFYTKTMHPLAIKYNDCSPLENMHASTAFEIMKENEDSDWFNLLDKATQAYMRKGVISMVLATDPASAMKARNNYKQIVDEAKESLAQSSSAQNTEEPRLIEEDKKLLLFGAMLHAADVSNPTKPQHMVLRWVGRLLQEFWAQGDEERSLGVPISMLCNRSAEIVKVPKGQLGFISFCIKPLYSIIVGIVEEAKEAVDQLECNVKFWEAKDAENATYEQIFGNAEDEEEQGK